MFAWLHEEYVRKLFMFSEAPVMMYDYDYGRSWIECSKSIQFQKVQGI